MLALCYSDSGEHSSGGKLLPGDWEIPCFTIDFALLTSDSYRFDLILLDCQKGQIIGPTCFQPKFEQEPSLRAVCSSWESQGNPMNFQGVRGIRAKAKCFWVISQIARKFLPVSSGSLIAWERSEEAQIIQVRGKVVPESICSNIFPSSLCPLPHLQIIRLSVHGSIPYICKFDAYRYNS